MSELFDVIQLVDGSTELKAYETRKWTLEAQRTCKTPLPAGKAKKTRAMYRFI